MEPWINSNGPLEIKSKWGPLEAWGPLELDGVPDEEPIGHWSNRGLQINRKWTFLRPWGSLELDGPWVNNQLSPRASGAPKNFKSRQGLLN